MAKVNRQELADILGVSLPTITSKVKRGMPFLQKGQRGKEWQFDTVEVFAWEKDQAVNNLLGDVEDVTEEELRRRKLSAETVITEIEAAKLRGEVAPIADMEKSWNETMIEICTRMMLVPSRCSIHILGMTEESEIKHLIEEEIRQGLSESADIDLNDNE